MKFNWSNNYQTIISIQVRYPTLKMFHLTSQKFYNGKIMVRHLDTYGLLGYLFNFVKW